MMKTFRAVVVGSLGMSIGLLASVTFEGSKGVMVIAAVSHAESNGVPFDLERAFIPRLERIKPLERKSIQFESMKTTLMAQSMGGACDSGGETCLLNAQESVGSDCVCGGETGHVISGIQGRSSGNKDSAIESPNPGKPADTKAKHPDTKAKQPKPTKSTEEGTKQKE